MERRTGLGFRRWAWIAVGLLGLPGVAFGVLAVVIGGFLGVVFLASIPLSKLRALDHVAAALTGSYIVVVWIVASSTKGWTGLAVVASIYCATLAMAKLGRIVGGELFGHARLSSRTT